MIRRVNGEKLTGGGISKGCFLHRQNNEKMLAGIRIKVYFIDNPYLPGNK